MVRCYNRIFTCKPIYSSYSLHNPLWVPEKVIINSIVCSCKFWASLKTSGEIRISISLSYGITVFFGLLDIGANSIRILFLSSLLVLSVRISTFLSFTFYTDLRKYTWLYLQNRMMIAFLPLVPNTLSVKKSS